MTRLHGRGGGGGRKERERELDKSVDTGNLVMLCGWFLLLCIKQNKNTVCAYTHSRNLNAHNVNRSVFADLSFYLLPYKKLPCIQFLFESREHWFECYSNLTVCKVVDFVTGRFHMCVVYSCLTWNLGKKFKNILPRVDVTINCSFGWKEEE